MFKCLFSFYIFDAYVENLSESLGLGIMEGVVGKGVGMGRLTIASLQVERVELLTPYVRLRARHGRNPSNTTPFLTLEGESI